MNYLILKTGLLCAALLSAGPAFAQANLEINTPGIAAIQGGMQKRHGELAPLYASGAVGLTRDGNVALRDPAAVPLAQRAAVNTLIAAENQTKTLSRPRSEAATIMLCVTLGAADILHSKP